jgi:hypothetical protein
MPNTIKARPNAIRPTPEEEEAIQRGIAQDPDNPEWTAEEIKQARANMKADGKGKTSGV